MRRHLLPSFLAYLIVSLTLSIPAMILGETGLSFLGIGIQPPALSWGALLQSAQSVRSVALAPWLFIPGLFIVATVLAYNFVGDGLRAHSATPPTPTPEPRRAVGDHGGPTYYSVVPVTGYDMTKSKLTLSLDPAVVQAARRLAVARNTSVSALFSCLIESLQTCEREPSISLGPLTRQASGIVRLPERRSDRDLLAEALLDRQGSNE